jgi:hypothetical protein
MILLACAESIILSTPPAESMILSALPKRQWKRPAAQWAAGCEAIALGNGTKVARLTAQCHRDEVFFFTSDLHLFLPDFCYSDGFLKLVVMGCTESSTTCQNPPVMYIILPK